MSPRTTRRANGWVAAFAAVAILISPFGASTALAADTGYQVHGLDAFDNSGWGPNAAGVNVRISDDTRAEANSRDDVVEYREFGFGIPSDATIDGIEVTLEGYAPYDRGRRQVDISLSGDGGSTYSSVETTTFGGSESVEVFGGDTELWGESWTPDSLSDANFRVKLDATSVGPTQIVYVDQLQVKVFFTERRRGGGSYVPPGTLIVKKVIDGVSTDSIDFEDFTLDIDGPHGGYFGPLDDDGEMEFVWQASTYSVTEEVSEGWITTYGGDCDENGYITVVSNEERTCVITNTWDVGVGGSRPDTGTLIVTKTIIGGPAEFDDFAFTVDGDYYEFWQAGMNSVEVIPGSHSVQELLDTDYTPTYGGDCDENGVITFGSNDVLTCEITNTYTGTVTPTPVPPAPSPSPTAPPAPGGPNVFDAAVGSSDSDGDGIPDEAEGMASDSMEEETMGTAAIGGLAKLAPCGLGTWGWLLVNIILAALIVFLWRGRSSRTHWLAAILLALLIILMLWFARNCAFGPDWLPVVISVIAWLVLRFSADDSGQQQADL